MYLKSLVLKGFKSFADRSALGFEPGITAVVGPNGSGKSNISDSVLWVLGERNAKNLRGAAMEDVIFAGSSARKAAGLAEVDLVLDNTDGTLPIDYSEVSLTRRMYRNGMSEYLINGTPARRMDVLDILHDSGLGTGTHSIISQGHLSQILQSKPEDRRALIEEAAGVLKHKQRKQKSERKLAQMDEHLTRVQDITAEVERQVKPLERKAKRALAYRDLADEMARLNLELAVDDLRVLQRKWDTLLADEKKLGEHTEQLHAAIDTAEANANALQDELQKRSTDAGDTASSYRRAQTALDRLDSTIMLLHERKRSMKSYTAEMTVSIDADSAKAQALAASLEEALGKHAAALAEDEKARAELGRAQSAYDDAVAARDGEQKVFDEAVQARHIADGRIEEVRRKREENLELLSDSRAHRKLMETRADELAERLEAGQKAQAEAGKTRDDLAAKLADLKKRDASAREAVAAAFTERTRAAEAFEKANSDWVGFSAEAASLEELIRARDTGNALLSKVLSDADETGVRALSDVLKIPADYVRIVEAVLGDDVTALFIDSTDAALSLVDRLGEGDEAGSVTLLSRDVARVEHDIPKGCTALTDVLEYDDAFADAVHALLGGVVVCPDRKHAERALAAGCPIAATTDGVIMGADGKVMFSRSDALERGALELRNELEEARDRLDRALKERDESRESRDRAEDTLHSSQAESLKLSQEAAALSGAAEAAAEEATRAEEAYAALVAEADEIARDRERAAERLAQAEPDARALEEQLAELTAGSAEHARIADTARSRLSSLREAAETAGTALQDAKLSCARAAEAATYAERTATARRNDIASAEASARRAQMQIGRKKTGLERIDPLIALFESLVAAARVRTEALERETAAGRDSEAGLHARINDARGAVRAAHDAFDAENERLAALRVEKGRMEMQVNAAIQTITEDCSTPIETALAMPALEDRPDVEDRAFKLRRRISNMGTINPDAAEEYEALKVRFDYLSGQLEDMLAARRTLAKIVRVIDARMKDDFVDTFATVDANYREIFATLFPGGQGSLSLVDPDDPENTGVEVNAQPSGKRILKMSLMSGGEQSLTAMALLFAVYKTRTTPFYILDEVEAALDDTNLRRLCAYLDSMRDSTQFIMITHQRRTMEMADVLYGISMQSDGVTKVVSQRLDKALKYAEG